MPRDRAFYSYLLHRVLVRTVLVFGIVTFGFFAVDNLVVRWDLTEDERFSISEASHRLAASLEAPLTIRAYFSERIPERIRPLQRQVFDILAEYEAQSGGNIKVERYDPLESTTAASEASNYGVQPVELRIYEATEASALQIYGGIVLIYEDRASEVINIAARYTQGYEGLSVLEYEISSKIWELTHEKPKVGITGYLSRSGQPANPFNPRPAQPRPDFTGLRQILGDAFEIEDVDLEQATPDPAKIPLLLIVRPKEFSDVEVFRLDQYVMRGGRVLMLITEGLIDQTQWGNRRFTYQPFKTGLDAWLEHNGLRVPNEFVMHLGNAVPIYKEYVREVAALGGAVRVQEQVANWFWPIFGFEGAIDRDNPAVQTLKVVSLWWPHPVDVLENKLDGKQATVLVRSHKEESWRWKDLRRIDRRDLDDNRDVPDRSDFVSSPVAVAIEGTFRSFYADQPVPPSLTGSDESDNGDGEESGAGNDEGDGAGSGEAKNAEKEETDGEKDDEEKKSKTPKVIQESVGPTQLVVIGNSFFVSNAFLGRGDDRAKQASLLAFNLVDWLARSEDLIALRAKRYSDRSLMDKAFEEDLKSVSERRAAGEIDADTFRTEAEKARERQKSRWKRSRWINIIVPCLLILFAGAIVWIVRAAGRAAPARVPDPVPPESLFGGE